MPMMHKKGLRSQYFHMIDLRDALADGWAVDAYTIGEKTELDPSVLHPGAGLVGPDSPSPSKPRTVPKSELPGEASLGVDTIEKPVDTLPSSSRKSSSKPPKISIGSSSSSE